MSRSSSLNAYPSTRRSDHVDVYKSEKHGEVRVSDPYNWLEVDSAETDAWTTAQVEKTNYYLGQISCRKKLEDAFRENFDYARFGPPKLAGDRFYWSYNSGLQAQYVIYRSIDDKLPDFPAGQEGPGGDVFFDSNLLTKDGTASISTYSFSECGKYFAYAISLSGSDTACIYVRKTDSPLCNARDDMPPGGDGRLDEELQFVKFSGITWTHDSKGFFYQRFPEKGRASGVTDGIETDADSNAMLYYHRVGTPQAEDILVYKDSEHPQHMFSADVSEIDGKFLFLYISRDTSRKNQLWVTDLSKCEIGQGIQWTKIIGEFEAQYHVLANDGSLIYLQTNKDAPQQKIVTVNVDDKSLAFKDFIPEDPDAHMEECVAIQDKFIVTYKRNVKDEVYVYSNQGKQLSRIAPDLVGTAHISGRRKLPYFFVNMTGFTLPGTIGKYDLSAPQDQEWSIYRTVVLRGLNPEDFVSEQVWFESTDGTKVPMFITRHKSTPLDGTAPAIQYGYGGFTISINPTFSTSRLTLCQRFGVVYATVNVRGGGEFGEEWHLAGTRERKANTFDDFISATKYLVDNKYAAPGKVAINGGSNGGLTVGACVNRAPELYGAAVADVGVLDYLKFHLFTIGKHWTSDYGNPSDPHDFDFMYPLSPLHNIPQDKVLPSFLLLTADHDDRVVPMHSFKHAATLQHMLPNNPNPLLIRIDKKAGHGGGKSTEKIILESADKWAFVADALGLDWRD